MALNVPTAHVGVSNDYDIPNFRFLYYVPSLPDDKKEDLEALQQDIYTWHAWELGQVEAQLNGVIEKGNVPSDDSVPSRAIRNNYRFKVVSMLRAGREAWLSLAMQTSGQKVFKTTPDKSQSFILQQLRALATEHNLQSQFGDFLNTISGSIDLKQENKFHFTHVYYRYDEDTRSLEPVISDTTFTIKKQDGEGKAGDDEFVVGINLDVNSYSFDRKIWRDLRFGEDAVKHGRAIRERMALEFKVDS